MEFSLHHVAVIPEHSKVQSIFKFTSQVQYRY